MSTRASRNLLPWFLIVCVASPLLAQAPPVPSQYSSLYSQLGGELNSAAALIQGQVPPSNAAPVMMSELISAASEEGPNLLTQNAKDNCTLELQRYHELGLRGVQVSMAWPIVQSPFPSYQQYQSFYAWVAQQAHSLGMQITVKFHTFFPGGAYFSHVNWSYAGLTVQQFATGLNQQAQWVLANMNPEYLTLMDEPDTNGTNVGISLDPTTYQTLIQGASAGLVHGSTKVAAGAGSWSSIDFFQNLATLSTLDALDVHIYPIIDNYLSNVMQQISQICSQNGKRMTIGEAWCEKVDQTTWQNRSTTQPTFMALKGYSFWEPLDEQFISIVWQGARLYNMEFVSFYSGCYYFWGNVAYSASTAMPSPLQPSQLFDLATQASMAGLQANTPTEVGQDTMILLGAAPAMTSPAPGSTLSSSSATFTWGSSTGATQYWLYVGTTAGGYDLYNQNLATALSATVTGLPTNGSTLYIRLWFLVGGAWLYVDEYYTAASGVVAPVITSPTPGSTLTSSSGTFTWNTGSGVTQYWLYVGTTLGGLNLYNQNEGVSLSATVNGLPTNGTTLYVRLWYLAGGVWLYSDFTYTAANQGIVAPVIISPTPGSRLAGSSVTFVWTAGSGATQYWLYVGRTPGGLDLYNQNEGTSLSATVTGLPTDSSTVYVRFWYLAGVWLYEDVTYTAANGGTPAITTPAPGSRLTSSSVTFTWTPGAAQYWLWVGTTAGGIDLYNQNEGTSLSATVSGLPTNGSTVYVRFWYLMGGVWLYADTTYAAQ